MISNNFFAILRLPETWVAPDEIMEQCCVFFLAVFSHFKTSPRLRQLFGKMLQHCFVVKRQKMFCGLRNFTPPLSVGEESFLGWTYPLEECFLFTSTSVNDLSTSSTGTDADTETKKKVKKWREGEVEWEHRGAIGAESRVMEWTCTVTRKKKRWTCKREEKSYKPPKSM